MANSEKTFSYTFEEPVELVLNESISRENLVIPGLAAFIAKYGKESYSISTDTILDGEATVRISPIAIDFDEGKISISIYCTAITSGNPKVASFTIKVNYNIYKYSCINASNKIDDVFKYFEPYHVGDRAIPPELYFLGAGGDGYQQYSSAIPGAAEINAVNSKGEQLYTKGGSPIRGCKRGTVVKAVIREHSEGLEDIEIWMEDGIPYFKRVEDSDDNKTSLEVSGEPTITRVGVILVGGGGAGGYGPGESWSNDCHTFDTTVPGGGGGGGAIVWGILNLETTSSSNRYKITVGKGGDSKGAAGGDTVLTHSAYSGSLAIAGGGNGGGKGTKKGTGGGIGGVPRYVNNQYFIYCGEQSGGNGGGYGEIHNDDENQRITSAIAQNKFNIYFLPADNYKITAGADAQVSFIGKPSGSSFDTDTGITVKALADLTGQCIFVIPGGNSYERGAYTIGVTLQNTREPGLGGGGYSWTFNDNNGQAGYSWEDVWNDTTDNYAKQGRQGHGGGWFLCY